MLIDISDQMGAQTDRLRCEVFQNLNLSPINTGLLRPAVATVLTVHGMRRRVRGSRGAARRWGPHISSTWAKRRQNEGDWVIELTVYGIETGWHGCEYQLHKFHQLQQLLPFTVLKLRYNNFISFTSFFTLQQLLPFTVLKLTHLIT